MSEKFASKDEFYLSKIRTLEAENKRIKDGWDAVDKANKSINARLKDTLVQVAALTEAAKEYIEYGGAERAQKLAALIQESE